MNKKLGHTIFFTLSIVVFGFSSNASIKYFPGDTAKSFKIESFWITPKHDDFYSLVKSSRDTLDLTTCEEYVYSPFGILKNKSDIRKGLLKGFNINTTTDTANGTAYKTQRLKLNTNTLCLVIDNDPEASKHSYIMNGEINDSTVSFSNGIKIGIRFGDFYNKFFKAFPVKLQNKYQVVILESCVTGIKHIYTFKNNRLISVVFQSVN